MNILALDTSSNTLSIALAKDDNVIAEINLNNGLVHSTTLMPSIEKLFSLLNFDKKSLDLLVVCNGPGSFTGIRIGVATINAMALALDIPVVSVSSLEALAMNCKYFDATLISTIDAQRDNFYVGIYKLSNTSLEKLQQEQVLSEDEIIDYIQNTNEKVIIMGDIVETLKYKQLSPHVISAENIYIRASHLITSAYNKYQKGDKSSFSNPIYMRKSQAEMVYDEKRRNEVLESNNK